MATEGDSPNPNENAENKSYIKRFSDLASQMGYLRDQTEKPTTWLRTYLNEITKNGFALLTVQDISNGDERMNVGVRYGRESSMWEKTWSIKEACLKADVEINLPWPVKGNGDVSKEFLRSHGYQEIVPILQKLQESGLYQQKLSEISQEISTDQRLIETIVIPTMVSLLPEFPLSSDKFLQNRRIYFYRNFKPDTRNVDAIGIDVSSGSFAFITGKQKPSYIAAGTDYGLSHEYFICQPGSPRYGWHFESGNETDAKAALEKAIINYQSRKTK